MGVFLRDHAVLIVALACIPWSGFFLWKTRDILGLSGRKLYLAPFIYVITGLAAMTMFSILYDIRTFPDFSLRHQGLLAFFPLLFPLFAKLLKKDLRDVSDALAVSIPGIIAMTRVFCLINGCCYGRFFPGTSVHIPLREIVMALHLAASFLLLLWIRRNHPRGILLPAYMLYYGIVRVTEVHFRFNPFWNIGGRDTIMGVVFITLGILIGIAILDRNDAEKHRKKHAR